MAPLVTRTLISFLPTGVAEVDLSPAINAQVFVFALVAAVVTALLFGLAPAFRAARAKPALVLKEESRSIGAGLGLRKFLVTAQIALALVLLIGAGLFVRTLESLRAKGPGLRDVEPGLLHVDAGRSGYSREPSRNSCGLLTNLRNLPEKEIGRLGGRAARRGELEPADDDRQRPAVHRRSVHNNAITSGFFATLGVPMLPAATSTPAR